MTTDRGAKQATVEAAVEARFGEWTLAEIEQACPGISHGTVRHVLQALQKAGRIENVGRGPGAKWRKKR